LGNKTAAADGASLAQSFWHRQNHRMSRGREIGFGCGPKLIIRDGVAASHQVGRFYRQLKSATGRYRDPMQVNAVNAA
jgi:hypothetical protein